MKTKHSKERPTGFIRNRRPNSEWWGFTLIELLVVIAPGSETNGVGPPTIGYRPTVDWPETIAETQEAGAAIGEAVI